MRNMLESIRGFLDRDWTMAEKMLVILCCILIGIINGFFLAPIKRGISCGNNNGNTYNQLDDEYWLDDED